MKKKIVHGILCSILVVVLSGCCMNHTWADATCTEPMKCEKCGKTQGEAAGHVWIEASCEEPKHCSACSATEGDALEHVLTGEANYQSAPMCSVCNKEVGEPLAADFETYKLTEKLIELDKEYDHVVMCDADSSKVTVAKLRFWNYQTFESGLPEQNGYFMIDSELPKLDGYEYKIVDVTIEFSDENALQYGAAVEPCFEDYYDIVKHDESHVAREDGWGQFTVNWNGEEYTECMDNYVAEWWTNEDATYSYNAMFIVRIPKGYDGYVLGFRNRQVEWEEGQYIFDLDNTDTLFFKFE